MPDIPEAVLAAAAEAVNEVYAKRGWNKPAPWWTEEVPAAVLDAAAPLLADKIASAILRYADENEPEPEPGGYLAWHRHFEAASAVAAKAFGRDNLEAAENVSASSAPTGEDGEP